MMHHLELPLVFFTVLAQAGIGLVLFRWIYTQTAGSTSGQPGAFQDRLLATVLVVVSLVASLGHLGHPVGAIRVLSNLQHSWLSREVLAFALLTAVLVAWNLTTRESRASRMIQVAGAVLAVGALIMQGFTYMSVNIPAIDSAAVPLIIFALTAGALGASLGAWFAPESSQPRLRRLLIAILACGLIVHVLLPSIWMAGSTVEAMTGAGYVQSTLYWIHLIAGILIPLAVLLVRTRIPKWLPAMILAGELAGRIAFFSLMAHTSDFIGMPL